MLEELQSRTQCCIQDVVLTIFCSALPVHASGGSAKLLAPAACSSLAAAANRSERWLALKPHLLSSHLGCFDSAGTGGTARAVLAIDSVSQTPSASKAAVAQSQTLIDGVPESAKEAHIMVLIMIAVCKLLSKGQD